MKNIEKPKPILLIEDNEVEVNEFKHYIEGRANAKLIKSTNSSYEGIEYTKMYMPEGIILDLELHNGEGSGIEFLEELQKIKLDFKPLIVVTTNVSSKIIYRRIRELGVDFIYYKKQSDYSPEMVINSMTSLRESLYNTKIEQLGSKPTTETPIEHENRIREKITVELDLVGIPHHLVGRKYIEEAIVFLIQNDNEEDGETVFRHLANEFKVCNSSVSRAMQTAINNAWRSTSIDDLMMHYKARINYETGVPTPTEFIYYYRDKIKENL